MKGIIFPRFLKWGDYTSQDEENPDVIKCQVVETQTFQTKYAVCANVIVDNEYVSLSLHNFSSVNQSLLSLWNKGVAKNKIKVDSKFQLHTWLEQSTQNKDRKIRRYKLIF